MKKKTEWVQGFTRDIVDSIEVGYDFEKDEAFFVTPMRNESLVRSYERKKNDKIVSKIPYTGKNFSFSRNKSLWVNYDHLVSIDTNNKQINGHKVSVTGITHGRKIISVDTSGEATRSWYYYSEYSLEFTDCSEDTEKTGWWLAITFFLKSEIYKNSQNIAIIVDAHLNDIDKFNNRKKPIYRNLFLPEKLTLIYASADTGMDDFANKMIKFADKNASDILKLFANDWTLPASSSYPNTPFKTLRKVYSNKNEKLPKNNKRA